MTSVQRTKMLPIRDAAPVCINALVKEGIDAYGEISSWGEGDRAQALDSRWVVAVPYVALKEVTVGSIGSRRALSCACGRDQFGQHLHGDRQ